MTGLRAVQFSDLSPLWTWALFGGPTVVSDPWLFGCRLELVAVASNSCSAGRSERASKWFRRRQVSCKSPVRFETRVLPRVEAVLRAVRRRQGSSKSSARFETRVLSRVDVRFSGCQPPPWLAFESWAV